MVAWLYMETKTFRGVCVHKWPVKIKSTCSQFFQFGKVICMWWTCLLANQRWFFRFFQRLVILGAVPKGWHPLGTRLDTYPYISKVMQQCPCSAYFELRQPVTIVSVLQLIVIIGIFFALVWLGFLLFLEDAYLHAYFGLLVPADFRSSSW